MILVGGIGNIFLGDDAFGSEVARQMLKGRSRDNVRIVDFGIRGVDLVYALLEDYDLIVLVDTVKRGGPPGTLYVIEPQIENVVSFVDAHGIDPVRALASAQAMGARLHHVRIIGCEPETFGPDGEGRMGLSAPVGSAVAKASELIESLIQEARV
jgi:hydrogenase maturation protease